MARNQKYAFLQALIITLIVFNLGIFMGYKLESSRINKIDNMYFKAEIDLLDQKTQKDAFEILDLNCELMVQENIKFADKIFEEAKIIDRFEKASRINADIILHHKRYDLLRTLLWMNSIRIKEKCNSGYSNIVYFYKYNDPSIDQSAKQKVFSNLLTELKEELGNKIILIPIAADNNISAINLILDKYEITSGELPVVLIDEETKINDLKNLEEIKGYL